MLWPDPEIDPRGPDESVGPLGDKPMRRGKTSWRSARWLVPIVYVGCTLTFVADLQRANVLAFGVFYIPLVATAVFHARRSMLWWLTGLACGMVIVGGFVPYVNPDLYDLIGNRLLSIIAILTTALFVQHSRRVQDELAEQTRRAEAAERIKTSVFADLSRDIRMPLYSMVGLLELMMADCRPDQRAPLGQVQGAGRRLLATIENLIDLTRVEEKTLQPAPVDVAALLRQVADTCRLGGAERQIAIDVARPAEAETMAIADPWATRRIIDNLLANAIKFSPPGSTVHVRLETGSETIDVVVQDAGAGMPPQVLRQLGEPFFQALSATGTGTGLALSRRLADAMGATITFESEPGQGTTATLRLRRSGAALRLPRPDAGHASG